MRAEQKIESCQEPQAPNDDPRPLESSERARFPAQQSTINSPTIHQLRSRLIRCLKSHINEPDWQLLLEQTEDFAYIEIRYGYYWRDGYAGVLPDGYDA